MPVGGVWPPRKGAVLSSSVWVNEPLHQRLRGEHWVGSGQGRDLAGLQGQELEKEDKLKNLSVLTCLCHCGRLGLGW